MPRTLAVPQFAARSIAQVQLTEGQVVIAARAAQEAASCPDGAHASQRLHRHSRRVLAAVATSGVRA